jgi:hypothetical protein
MYVVVQLGQIELALLFVLMLCLALLDTPVPRVLALPAAALVTVQTAALHALHERDATFTVDPAASERSGGVAAVVAVVVVPALGAALFAVVFWFFARANARTRAQLRRAAARPSEATCPPAAPARPPASPAARRATVPPGPAQPGG